MLQCLYCTGASGRVPLAHGSHQVNGFRAGIRDQLLQRCGAEMREAELHLAGQLHAFRPGLLCGGAHHTADLVDLICLCIKRMLSHACCS